MKIHISRIVQWLFLFVPFVCFSQTKISNHDYEVTNDGIITGVNLIIATGNNNLAMNAGVKQVAQTFVDGNNM